jgi:hypothetical protein
MTRTSLVMVRLAAEMGFTNAPCWTCRSPIIDCPPAIVMRDYTAFATPFFNTIRRKLPFAA